MSTRLVNGGRIKNGVFETYDKGTKSYVSTDQKVNAKDFGKTEVGKATQYSGDNALVAAYSNNYKPANAKKQKVTSSNSVLDTRQTTDAVNNAGNALVVDGGGNNNFQQSGLMNSMYNSQNVQNEAYQDQFQALELMFDAGLARQNQKYGQLQQELQDNLQKATQIADVNAAALNPYSQAQGAATADNFKGKIVQDYQKQAQNLQAQAEAAEQELRAGNYEAYVNISNAMKTSNAQFQQGIQEFLVNQQAMVQDQANKDRSFGLQEDKFNYDKSQDAIDNFQTFVNDFGMDEKLRGEIGTYFESGVVSEGLRPLIEKGVEAGYSMDEALSIAQYDTLEQTKERNDQAYQKTQQEISWYNAETSRISANRANSANETDAEFSISNRINSAETVINQGFRALTMLDGSWTNSGILGQASRFIEGSAAGELESVYETMRGVFSLDSIAKLKEASPTGSTGLGAVSNIEFNALGASETNLKTGLGEEVQRENIAKGVASYQNIMMSITLNDQVQAGIISESQALDTYYANRLSGEDVLGQHEANKNAQSNQINSNTSTSNTSTTPFVSSSGQQYVLPN